jgi:hypothetical protein
MLKNKLRRFKFIFIFIYKNYLNIYEQTNNNQTYEIGDDEDNIIRFVILGTNKRRRRCFKELPESE